MTNAEILNSRTIVRHLVGSRLYGTDLPTSDTDYGGLFMPPDEALIGLSPMEQIDVSEKDKDASGRNTADATDAVFYSLHRYARLAMNNNPNVLEWLFVPADKILFDTRTAMALRKSYELFVSMQVIPRFFGYATAQKHKMVLRSDKWQALHAFRDYLTKFEPRQVLVEIRNDKDHEVFCAFKGDNCVVGDMNIQRTALVKKAIEMLTERIDKGTNRQDTILLHGYDTKFGSHLIRLLMECYELLTTGKLLFPLTYADTLKDIKTGKWKVNEVLDNATEIENRIRALEPKKPLRDTADFHKVEQMVMTETWTWMSIEDEQGDPRRIL